MGRPWGLHRSVHGHCRHADCGARTALARIGTIPGLDRVRLIGLDWHRERLCERRGLLAHGAIIVTESNIIRSRAAAKVPNVPYIL
jgi:hypothetical protein